MEDERRERIKMWMGACLVIVAFTADLAELVLEWLGVGLAINIVTTPVYSSGFWLWFKILGVPFIASPKKFFTLFITCFAEIIPGLDAFGGFFWTLGMIVLVVMVRSEDKGGIVGEISGASMGIMQRRYSSYKSTFNNPAELREMKKYLAISKNELAEEARMRNSRFSQGQYGRASNQYGKIMGNALEKEHANILNLKKDSGQQPKVAGNL